MKKEIAAALRAATAKPDYLTLDHLGPGLGGWGAFNIGVWAAANVIAREMKRGKELKLEVETEPHTDLDEVAKKAVDTLRACGADPANAALTAATLLYFAGGGVQCGMPCPNRKLGAVTRMAAGIPSGRISSMPTEKQNNKISGFAATLAIYQALDRETLAPYDASFLPMGAGGPVIGHSSVGEDHLFPKLGKRLAQIGTAAMIRAYGSAGMKPNKWLSALFGTAAALEIIHPDAYVGEEYGQFLVTRTPSTTAEAAVSEAGLPETIHVRGTGKEMNTARVVGDLAIILKDSGTPTVVGMIMFSEICSIFQEGGMIGVGRGGGPLVIPLHHWVTAPTLAMHMIGRGAGEDEVVDAIRKTLGQFFHPEQATVATSVLARKAEAVGEGPVTDAILRATEPGLVNAVAKRAVKTSGEMERGRSLRDIVDEAQRGFIESSARSAARAMSEKFGRDVEYIKFLRVEPGSGRRKHKFAHRHFAFDARIDVEVKVDGKVHVLENTLAKAVPDALISQDRETLEAFSATAMAVIEILCAGACSLEVVVPACVAAARGMDPDEAVAEAVEAGHVFVAIPPSPGLAGAVRSASEIAAGLDFQAG